jgi:GNAT superfamily N-acetyltransferase
MDPSQLKIRPALRADAALLLELVRELAEYERLPATATERDFLRDGFGQNPKFRAFIAEWDGKPAGYAVIFENYSTFEGRVWMYLEDLFVRPAFRGRGIGKALLAQLAALAQAENCSAMKWQVLDWNTPSIEFYRRLGGDMLEELKTVLLSGKALQKLAGEAS